jgi:pullulanase
VLNATKTTTTMSVPIAHYTVVCRDGVINELGLGSLDGGQVTVSPQSALIMHD